MINAQQVPETPGGNNSRCIKLYDDTVNRKRKNGKKTVLWFEPIKSLVTIHFVDIPKLH